MQLFFCDSRLFIVHEDHSFHVMKKLICHIIEISTDVVG